MESWADAAHAAIIAAANANTKVAAAAKIAGKASTVGIGVLKPALKLEDFGYI